MTSSIRIVKLDETKCESVISSNADVMDRMKIQNIKYVPKSGMSYFAPAYGKILLYICKDAGAGKRQVCWSPLCSAREYCNASLVGETVASAR